MSSEERGITILLTRPAGQNEGLARLLKAGGFATLIRPLLEIVPVTLDDQKKRLVMELDRFDDVIFVSGNAVTHGLPWLERYWPQWPLALRWSAVGPATAARLGEQHIPVTFPAEGASEGLLGMDAFQSVAGRNILIVRGVGGRELLADTLRTRGAAVRYLEVYERRPVDYDARLEDELKQQSVACAVITSGEALERLARLVDARHFPGALLVPSERIRSLAIGHGFAKVGTLDNMDDESIARAVTDIA